MKLLSNIIEGLIALILIPLILAYKLITGLAALLLVLLICASPFILIGFIAWLIFN